MCDITVIYRDMVNVIIDMLKTLYRPTLAQAPPLHHLPSLQPIAPPFKFDDLDILMEVIRHNQL